MATITHSENSMGFLGPEGSWTHQACLDLRTDGQVLIAFSADELFRAYTQARVTKICIPYHSSLAGLTPYFDQATGLSKWWIEKDYRRSIEHSLVGLEAVPWHSVERVLGHPVALAEVAPWLEEHVAHARLEPVASGGQAISTMRQINQRSCVAVAPAPSCRQSNVTLLVPSIPTNGPNVTSWWVLGNRSADQKAFLWWRVLADKDTFESFAANVLDLGYASLGIFSSKEDKPLSKNTNLLKLSCDLATDIAHILKRHHLDFELVGTTDQ
jgi:chorismate mutase / prephenate dehydratase